MACKYYLFLFANAKSTQPLSGRYETDCTMTHTWGRPRRRGFHEGADDLPVVTECSTESQGSLVM